MPRRMRRAEHDSRPIWMAVLVAAGCQALTRGREHAVQWEWEAGRAVYANTSADAELIQPLGVRLEGGHTLAIYWAPGETAYSMETFSQDRRRVA